MVPRSAHSQITRLGIATEEGITCRSPVDSRISQRAHFVERAAVRDKCSTESVPKTGLALTEDKIKMNTSLVS